MKTLWQLILISIKRPAAFFSSISLEKLKVLMKAVSKEPPHVILKNFNRLLDNPPLNSEDFVGIQIDECVQYDGKSVVANGWALANSGIKKIEVWQNGKLLGLSSYGEERTDVSQKFLTDNNNTGFIFHHDYHVSFNELEFKFISNTGEVQSKKVKIKKPTQIDGGEKVYERKGPPIKVLKNNFNKSKDFYCKRNTFNYDSSKDILKTIAFYLPQFHTIPENDEWWGKGFTEWTNVTQGVPRFEGHYQPRLPGEFGFYNLEDRSVMPKQVDLAKQYGIHGFCFHYYWFSGRRVLEKPINQFFERKELDLNFCVNWANENWTRRWDGAEDDVLLAQKYTTEDAIAFYKEVSTLFDDKRYIRIDGRPLLLVYRPQHIPNIKDWTALWRKLAIESGEKPPYLLACGSFEYINPKKMGFDGSVEFPPHQLWQRYPAVEFEELDITHRIEKENENNIPLYDPQFAGRLYDYRTISRASFREPEIDKPWFRCVMPSWDNEARKKGAGHTFMYADPDYFRNWFRNACRSASKNKKSEQLVFINAWNEWAEGTYLEPDRHYGYANLQVISEVLSEFSPTQRNKELFPPNHFVKKANIAVILHLYYTDLFEEFAEQLSNINESFDLYVSLTTENEEFKETILKRYPGASIFVGPNRGRDMGPFMEVMNKISPLNYELILKIHSKKSTYIEDGQDWRKYLLDNLLGSTSNVNSIIKQFRENEDMGVLAPQKSWLPFKGWYIKDNMQNMYRLGSFLKINHLIKPLDKNLEIKSIKGRAPIAENVDLKKPHFVGGSMFWFKPKALDGLFSIAMHQEAFEEENAQLDGTIAHAIERIIGLLALHNKFKLGAIMPRKDNVLVKK